MALHLPSCFADLTLYQLAALETLQDPIKRVEACCAPNDDVRAEPLSVLTEANEHLSLLQQAETRKHLKVITIDGVEYGFIPDWEAFTTGEWIDLETYVEDFWANAHKVMSVLYRPIERRSGEIYTIAPYSAKEPSEAFKELPADLFAGAMLFFSTSRRELLTTTRSSLLEIATEAMSSVKNGDGIPSYTDSQTKTSSKWTRLRHYLMGSSSHTSHSLKT